jgi:hypothetical protein
MYFSEKFYTIVWVFEGIPTACLATLRDLMEYENLEDSEIYYALCEARTPLANMAVGNHQVISANRDEDLPCVVSCISVTAYANLLDKYPSIFSLTSKS